MMDTAYFPDCCGIRVLCGFAGRGVKFYDYSDNYHEQLEDFLKAEETKLKAPYYPSVGMVILNHHQMEHIGEVFKKAGWKLIAGDLYHSGHSSYLYILIKEAFPSKRRKKNAVMPTRKTE